MSSILDSAQLGVGGLRTLIPRFASLVASASGATQLVAANGSNKIRVLSYVIVASAAVNAKFQSAANDKTGLLYCASNTGVSAPFSPVGHFETNAGEALNVSLSGAVPVGGHITYALVPST